MLTPAVPYIYYQNFEVDKSSGTAPANRNNSFLRWSLALTDGSKSVSMPPVILNNKAQVNLRGVRDDKYRGPQEEVFRSGRV